MIEKKYLAPNAITATNMLLGYLSITSSIEGKFQQAVWFIIAAMVCDTLDGKTARKLDAFSEFGKEFDSFCDAISFGLAPGIFVFTLLSQNFKASSFILPISFIYALCGVMRLVKFNIMTTASSEKDDFSGMPIPCGASVVVGFYLFCSTIFNHLNIDIFSVEIFSLFVISAGALMISTIPFKTPDKVFAFIPKKVFPIFLLGILITLKFSLFIITLYYILYNLYFYFVKRLSHHDDNESKSIEE